MVTPLGFAKACRTLSPLHSQTMVLINVHNTSSAQENASNDGADCHPYGATKWLEFSTATGEFNPSRLAVRAYLIRECGG